MNTQLMPVTFHGDTLVLVGKDGEPFVAMKPVVSNMGLVWAAQYVKIQEKFGTTVSEIETVAEDGKLRSMTCLPLRKLAAWLYSVSPNKVAPELRDKIIQYQEECDEVLWNYWTKGAAIRPASMSASQMVVTSKHRLGLMKEMMRTRDRVLRTALTAEITKLSNTLDLPVPELEQLGGFGPTQADIAADFWAALLQLDSKGVAYNHSKKPHLLALSLPHLAELFSANGIKLVLGSEVTAALKRSADPLYLDLKVVDSLIKGKPVKCWVFNAPNKLLD